MFKRRYEIQTQNNIRIRQDTLDLIHRNAIAYSQLLDKEYMILADNGNIMFPIHFTDYNFMHFCGFSNDRNKMNFINIKPKEFYQKAISNTLTLEDIDIVNHKPNNKDVVRTIKEKVKNFSIAFAPYLEKANQVYIGVGALTDTSPYDFIIWSKNHGNDTKGREYGASIALNHGSMTNSRGQRILADFMVPISLRTETKEEVLKHSDNIYKVDYILCRDYVQHNDNKTYTSLIYDTDYKKNHNSHNWDSIFSYLDKNTKLNLNIKGIQLPLAIRYKQSMHKLSEKYELTESEESFFKNIINERQGDRLYPTLALSLYGRYIEDKADRQYIVRKASKYERFEVVNKAYPDKTLFLGDKPECIDFIRSEIRNNRNHYDNVIEDDELNTEER